MIDSKVENGQSFFVCTECGATHQIIQYYIDHKRMDTFIDHEKTLSEVEAFVTKHKICKQPVIQTNLFQP